jgi:hypothetical protein
MCLQEIIKHLKSAKGDWIVRPYWRTEEGVDCTLFSQASGKFFNLQLKGTSNVTMQQTSGDQRSPSFRVWCDIGSPTTRRWDLVHAIVVFLWKDGYHQDCTGSLVVGTKKMKDLDVRPGKILHLHFQKAEVVTASDHFLKEIQEE